MAKSRVKITDFTNRDKTNLLELFVNNEKTLLKIYEILFPHRAGPNAGAGVSNSMVVEAGLGNYGQNALRALSRGTGRSQGRGYSDTGSLMNVGSHQQRISVENNSLLNALNPKGNIIDYNAEMLKYGGFYPN